MSKAAEGPKLTYAQLRYSARDPCGHAIPINYEKACRDPVTPASYYSRMGDIGYSLGSLFGTGATRCLFSSVGEGFSES